MARISAEMDISIHLKTSFQPISTADINILILGSMPGDASIALHEYYGHPRNRFWKVIAHITQNELPLTYADKKTFLQKNKIGLWDVVDQANRPGSLDTAIRNEMPNDLPLFFSEHPKLKIIGFNGLKAEALYHKYFERRKDIRYVSLPSTSPANAAFSFDRICEKWVQILDN